MDTMRIKKYLVFGIKVGVFTMMIAPLIMGFISLNVSGFPKMFFLKTVVTFIIILYSFLLCFDSSYAPQKSRIMYATLALITAMGISTLLSFSPRVSMWGGLEEVFSYSAYLTFALLLLVLTSSVLKESDWMNILRISVSVSGMVSMLALLQKAGAVSLHGTFMESGGRVTSSLANPAHFAAYLVIAFGFTALVFYKEKIALLKYAWLGVFAVHGIALVLAEGRTAWVAVLVSGFLFLINYSFRKRTQNTAVKKRVMRWWLIAVAGVATVHVALVYAAPQSLITQRYIQSFGIVETLKKSGRIDVWNISLHAFSKKPLLGWGILSGEYVFEKYAHKEVFKIIPEHLLFTKPHNTFIEMFLVSGFFGGMAYLAVFAFALWLLYRSPSVRSFVLVSILVGYGVIGLTLFDTPSALLLFVILLAYIAAHYEKKTALSFPKKIPMPASFGVAMFVSAALSALWYWGSFVPFNVSRLLIEGYRFEQSGNITRALKTYNSALNHSGAYKPDIALLVSERLVSLSSQQLEDSLMEQIFSQLQTLSAYLSSLAAEDTIVPFRSFEQRVKIAESRYLSSRDPAVLDSLRKILDEARDIFPNRPRFMIYKGKELIYSKRYDEGEKLFKEGFLMQLEFYLPRYVEMYKVLGIAYSAAGDEKKALDTLYTMARIAHRDYKQNNASHYARAPQQDVEFMLNVAYGLFLHQEFEKSEEVVTIATDLFPHKASLVQEYIDLIKNNEKSAV